MRNLMRLGVSILLLCFTLQGQSQGVNEQFLLYLDGSADGSFEANFASSFSPGTVTVIESRGPSQNLALFQVNSFPTTYSGGSTPIIINSMVQIMSMVNPPTGGGSTQSPPEIDGGMQNREYFPSKGIGGNGSCAPTTSTTLQSKRNIRVGIFDTGVNYDIANNVGYKFNNVIEINGPVNDTNDHGTHIASVIHDVQKKYVPHNNTTYMIGNSFNDAGTSTLADIILDIEDALHIGMDITNCSFSYASEYPQTDPFGLLIASPVAANTLFICAAGNDGLNLDDPGVDISILPAELNLSNVLTVGSIGCSGKNVYKSIFSNYGGISVDFGAPGERIPGIDRNGMHLKMTGSSQACAYATGVACVMATAQDNAFDAILLRCRLESSIQIASNLMQVFVNQGYLDGSQSIYHINHSCVPGGGSIGTAGGQLSSRNNEIDLFPNPFNDIVNVHVTLDTDQKVEIQLLNIKGQSIRSIHKNGISGFNSYQIDLSDIPSNAFYLIQINHNNSTFTRKIIKN